MNEKILVIEDEKEIADLIVYTLKREGFDVSVAYNGEDALKKLWENTYDLLVLDLMLPQIQGIEICKIVRSNPKMQNVGIIIVTAKGDEFDKVVGLDMGADDYLTKPFSPRELVARIKAILRRTKTSGEDKIIKIRDMIIDKEKYLITVRDKQIKLSATEFKLLLYLAERPNKIFNRDHLLDAVWGQDIYVDSRTVDVHIRRLRLKIEKDPDNPEYIKTMRGVGYYIEA